MTGILIREVVVGAGSASTTWDGISLPWAPRPGYRARKEAMKLKANLIDKAIVTDLTLDADGKIDGVAYRTWDDPREQRVKAKIVVVASNGIEGPKLLLMSNQRRGVANSSDQVGRNLMDHLGEKVPP
jgi:choline dehydrogenase-like flavoprotein